MKEQILGILKERDASFTLEEIVYKISDNPTPKEFNMVEEILRELIKENIIYFTNKNKFMLLENSHLIKGKLEVVKTSKRTFGFILQDKEDDIYVYSKNFNGAINGDIVIGEVKQNKKGEKEAIITKVVEKNKLGLLGEIIIEEGIPKVILDDKKQRISVNLINYPSNLVDGLRVSIKLEKEVKPNIYNASIEEIYGHKNEPGTDIKEIAHEFGIPTSFPDGVIEEIKLIPGSIDSNFSQRKDLRKKTIFTIDGADTKDIDDAISLEILNDGNYLLGVHIADVSNYVKEKSEIDKEAFKRGNSYYLADRVIPMLPVELSNGICSLNPNVDRFAKTCEMLIDKNTGKVLKYEAFRSVIKSKKKMTYTCVNQVFENKEVEGYSEFKETLFNMLELSKLIRKERTSRGSIDFDQDEIKLKIDEEGYVSSVEKRERGLGERLIEDFMIVANESVARIVTELNLPFVYRVHDKPKKEQLQNFIKYLTLMGHKLLTKINYENATNKEMQELLGELKAYKNFTVLSSMLLRCMDKAEYDPENIGHFGLGSKCYTHFTSPIRRYSDLMVHRCLDKYIFDKQNIKEATRYFANSLPFICESISKTERLADDCEREVDKMKIAEYFEGVKDDQGNIIRESHIGQEFYGFINGVLPKGFFVETDELIDGLVAVTSLKGKFSCDQEAMALLNGNTGEIYRVGDRVQVKCVNASKLKRQIDFELVKKLG